MAPALWRNKALQSGAKKRPSTLIGDGTPQEDAGTPPALEFYLGAVADLVGSPLCVAPSR